MKIVADDKIPFLKGILEPYAEVVYLPGNQISRLDIIDADAVLTRSVTKCNSRLLEGTSVKLIASATIGDDHIDKEFCSSQGISITTAKGCNAKAVSQYVFTALFALGEKFSLDIINMTIGIIGVGNIGSLVEKTALSLGMNVMLNDPPRTEKEGAESFVTLNMIQKEADIITLHVPLSLSGKNRTDHLLDRSFFDSLEKPVILINTSRGQVINTRTLKTALIDGNVGLSVLDVWENEPAIDPALLNAVNIGTPHIAGYSMEGKANATAMVVKSVSSFFNLGIDKWYPELPADEKALKVDGKGLSEEQVLQFLIKGTYDIWQDDRMLRENVRDFEKLRNDYTFRRETQNYVVNGENLNDCVMQKIKILGFRTR